MNQPPILNDNEKWDYLELNEIYFKKPVTDCVCPFNKMRGNSTGAAERIEGLGAVAQHRYKDKQEFLRDLRQCMNTKFDNRIRNQYQKVIQIGYQPNMLEKLESHKIPKQWEHEQFLANQEKKKREAEANSKVETYLAEQDKQYNTEQPQKQEVPQFEKRRSISITIQSIEVPSSSEEQNNSPLEKELTMQDSDQYLKKSQLIRRVSQSTLDTDINIEESYMRPRIYSTNTQRPKKAKVSLIEAGKKSVFSEVNDLSHINVGRRSQARIRQLEHDIKSELKSIKASKSKMLMPPRPNKIASSPSQTKIEFETIDIYGCRNRRQLFVDCSVQIMGDNMEEKYKRNMPRSVSQLSTSRFCDKSTDQSLRSRMSSRNNDNPSLFSFQQSYKDSKIFKQ